MIKTQTTPPAHPAPQAEVTVELDERIDAELDQTFPASDPLPWHHDTVPAVRTRVPPRKKSPG
ncbi:MAG: hypothetical protein ACRETU_01090 [Steroidobacterales bacterium]